MATLRARPSGWQADRDDPAAPANLPEWVTGDAEDLVRWKTPMGYVKVELDGVDVDPETIETVQRGSP